jgi:hypothetical protein
MLKCRLSPHKEESLLLQVFRNRFNANQGNLLPIFSKTHQEKEITHALSDFLEMEYRGRGKKFHEAVFDRVEKIINRPNDNRDNL